MAKKTMVVIVVLSILCLPLLVYADYTGPTLKMPLSSEKSCKQDQDTNPDPIQCTVEAGGTYGSCAGCGDPVIAQDGACTCKNTPYCSCTKVEGKNFCFGTDSYHTGNGYYSLDFNDRFGNKPWNVSDCCPGDDVLASAAGTVTTSENTDCGIGGKVCKVVIDHGGGYTTEYLHMVEGSIIVKVGQQVKQRQKLGVIGTTGASSGEHLHFSIKHNNDGKEGNENLKGVTLDGKPFTDFETCLIYSSTNTTLISYIFSWIEACESITSGTFENNWQYSCNKKLPIVGGKITVATGSNFVILSKVEKINTSHAFLVRAYHNDNFAWEWKKSFVNTVESGTTWEMAYFDFWHYDVPKGTWTYKVFMILDSNLDQTKLAAFQCQDIIVDEQGITKKSTDINGNEFIVPDKAISPNGAVSVIEEYASISVTATDSMNVAGEKDNQDPPPATSAFCSLCQNPVAIGSINVANASTDCASGLVCVSYPMNPEKKNVCVPLCSSDSDCPSGTVCNIQSCHFDASMIE